MSWPGSIVVLLALLSRYDEDEDLTLEYLAIFRKQRGLFSVSKLRL